MWEKKEIRRLHGPRATFREKHVLNGQVLETKRISDGVAL